MPETFLILFAGGIMAAAAISNPRDVTLLWLRLCGIIALALGAIAGFLALRREGAPSALSLASVGLALACILAQLAFDQVAWRATQRVFALMAFAAAVWAGWELCPVAAPWKNPFTQAWTEGLTLAGVALVSGLALMDMLLGHAYLTASQMTMRPFSRLNNALGIAVLFRAAASGPAALWLQSAAPIPMFMGKFGLLIGTRWLVGLLVPGIFIFMARDCINRRATQSATGILYVAGVLLLIGEIIALDLFRSTGLPF